MANRTSVVVLVLGRGTNLMELSPSEMSDHSGTVWGLCRAADKVGLVIKYEICEC